MRYFGNDYLSIDTYLDITDESTTDSSDIKMSTIKNEEVPVRIDEKGEAVTKSRCSTILARCPISISTTTIDDKQYTVFDAYITGSIEDMSGYVPLIDLLNRADENSIFYIHIQSGGGMVTTGATISSAIATTKAHVVTIAEGLCASAASLIWSAGHECRVGDYAMFMYHMSSHMDMNNSLYVKENAEKMVNYVSKCLMRKALKSGHFTEEEYIKFCDNKDEVWISADVMKERLNNNHTTVHEDEEID